MEKLVITWLRGRLGNQLFCYATGYATARRNECALALYDPDGKSKRPGGLTEVIAPFRTPTATEMIRFGCYDYDTHLRWMLRYRIHAGADWWWSHSGKSRWLIEETLGSPFELHEEVLRARAPIMIDGYFQHEGYFADYADDIRATIRLPTGGLDVLTDLRRPLVAITFRRGDYVNFGWELPLSYYRQSIERLRQKADLGSLLVFADDGEFAELAAPWLSGKEGMVVVPHVTRDPILQLAMMADCDHHILANSTFCWWGAWLSEGRQDREQIFFTPSDWVGKDYVNHRGIIPQRWGSGAN